jgi:hypothetical protein
MVCDRRNVIVIRKEQRTIVRCADPACAFFTKEVTDEQCATCPRSKLPTMPSLTRQAIHYTMALGGWVTAGRPERTDEEVRQLYETHCAKCDWRVGQKCRGCGCNIAPTGSPLRNKIKMATEHCPKGLY